MTVVATESLFDDQRSGQLAQRAGDGVRIDQHMQVPGTKLTSQPRRRASIANESYGGPKTTYPDGISVHPSGTGTVPS